MSFFATVPNKFADVPIDADGNIATEKFLRACAEIIPFFDVLGSTAFAPVKSDINGNVTRLQQRYDTDKAKFSLVQKIVEDEIAAKKQADSKSCTVGLLWLKRALEFIYHFLKNVLAGEPDLAKCATAAYESSLKQYHGFLVKGIFSLAMKAVPARDEFFKALGKGVADEATVKKEMQEFVDALGKNLDILIKYYKEKKLDSDAKA